MESYSSFFTLINPVLEVVKEASNEILRIYNEEAYHIKIKKDDSPVTTADLMANEIICKGLKQLSIYPIISEEYLEVPYEERAKYDYFWLIDPLDGTKEFINRNGQFTINIALVHNQSPILGIVAVPFFNEVYYAVKGCGAFLEKNDKVCRMQCRDFDQNKVNMDIPVSMSHINHDTRSFIEQFNDPNIISRGSALKFMMIANGEADIYPRMAPTMEWDTAAPQIIVEEAGGSLIDYSTNQTMLYNKESLINPGFITYTKR